MSVYLVSNLATTPDTPPAAGSPCSVTGCGCVHRVTRYPSDTTDAEWEVLEPHAQAVMAELRRGPGGRPMAHRLRAVVDAVRYLVRYGIEWRALPADFPPFLWNPTCPVPSEIRLVDMCSPVGSKAGRLMCCEHGDLWF
ncbi:transposase [Streptomyces sp. SP18BB07]|uniref:transposase n=1 Tax=Streptomyces sp. SP18BB07 TaxID=3002522 RepID=UPI002E75AD78|nr:transposase [Streptomyces sp. SP18BB07]MEE1757521.1 transposase [Streptomyces sp. SP18BB07]